MSLFIKKASSQQGQFIRAATPPLLVHEQIWERKLKTERERLLISNNFIYLKSLPSSVKKNTSPIPCSVNDRFPLENSNLQDIMYALLLNKSKIIKCQVLFEIPVREKESMLLFCENQSPWQSQPFDSVWPLVHKCKCTSILYSCVVFYDLWTKSWNKVDI